MAGAAVVVAAMATGSVGATPPPVSDASGECRDVEHLLGTTCVPEDATRILAYDPLTVLPTLLALDVPVAGAVSPYSYGDDFVSYLDPLDVEGVEIIGGFDAEINLEAVAAFDPDLIIGSVSRLGDVYDQVSEIAPTVVTGYAFYEVDWRTEVEIVAAAVDRSDEAAELLAGLDDHIASTAEALGGQGLTLTRVDVWQGTPLYYRFGCIWLGELLEGVGIGQPEAQVAESCDQQDPATAIGYPSLEEFEVLDADAIVAYQQQASEDDIGADPTVALAESPVWATLGAVNDDRVYVVGDAWGLGGSVQAAHQILDDLVDTVFADEATPAGVPGTTTG
ncbi:MAG: ABC transporter substrate-binding protein [Desertimonas sp.]